MRPPPTLLLYQPAWMVAVWRVYPNLGRWLVRISPHYHRQVVIWIYTLHCAYRLWLCEPPQPILILLNGQPLEPLGERSALLNEQLASHWRLRT